MRIKNWERFQHYKQRKPPWIRLYTDLLNDPDWFDLSGDAAKLLVQLWLVASELGTDGYLPDSRKLAFRLHLDSKVLAKLLSELSQWIELDASTPLARGKQVAIPESESESESESDQSQKERERSSICKSDWRPQAKTVDDLIKEGFNEVSIGKAIEQMRDWSQAGGKRKMNWDAALRNWVRRNAETGARKNQTQLAMERNLARYSD